MTAHPRSDAVALDQRDRGHILPIILAFVVIGTLVILPLLSYSVTVLKANQVVSRNTAEAEAARAGLRFALADPGDTYSRCGASVGALVSLPGPGLEIPTTTTCELLRTEGETNQPVYGIAYTWFGEPAASGTSVGGVVFDEPLVDETDWLDYVDATRDPELDARIILAPDLPVHSLTNRSSTPYAFPANFPFDGFDTCRAYFPGTYPDPVVVTGPTYFASGVYYFENEVRIIANTVPGGEATHAVGGQGEVGGCIDDVGAALSAVSAPEIHNISGLGATFVLGGQGRIVVDDTDGPVTFAMNQRFVRPDDDDHRASAKVSIMTVNGVWDAATTTYGDLALTGELLVPSSIVADDNGGRPAVDDGYFPSVHTPALRAPTPPDNLAVSVRNLGGVFSWDPPVDNGGDDITSYTVELVDTDGAPIGQSCTATDNLACTIAGLTNGTSYRAEVTATNDVGTSDPTEVQVFVPDAAGPSISAPGSPSNISITENELAPVSKQSRFVDAFEVHWDAPTNTGEATIDAYEVEITIDTDVYSCASGGSTSCVVSGITGHTFTEADVFQISVRARNVASWSSSATSGGYDLDELGDVYVAPTPEASGRYGPSPVLEIDSTSTHALNVIISGQIAVPQGVIEVSVADPVGKSVELEGGVLAAWAEISDPAPGTLALGLSNETTQRVVRIATSVTDSDMSAEAVVQINETGAWAVNSWIVE